MVSAILFDLDGTLLDIDINPFLSEYFSLLGPVLSSLMGNGVTPKEAVSAVIAATDVMSGSHPGVTNRDAFDQAFRDLTTFDLSTPGVRAELERFYKGSFPRLKSTQGPHPHAEEAVRTAVRSGYQTALATNPIFPREAIEERLRWTGIDIGLFDLITSYESMQACKPSRDYFLQVARELGVPPAECLMVGDDHALDLPAADVGMKTFYVGSRSCVTADWAGTLEELSALLPRAAGSRSLEEL